MIKIKQLFVVICLLPVLFLTACHTKAASDIRDEANGGAEIGTNHNPYADDTVTGAPVHPAHRLALVAHAGGAVNGFEGSNSIEAVRNATARGFRYIELDMITTSDGKIVLNHSWPTVSNRIAGVRDGIMTYAEFMDSKIFNQFTATNLDMLIAFLRENPGPRIIMDTKDTDYAAVYAIATLFPEYRHRFIPQTYAFGDAARLRALGFEDIIITLYMMESEARDPFRLHQYALDNALYAVAVPDVVVESFLSEIDLTEMRYMAHTVDTLSRAFELFDMGFYAIHTGFLTYNADFSDITRVPSPVGDFLSRVSENMTQLNEEQQVLAQTAMFYCENIPVYVRWGDVMPIWSDYLVAAPFTGPATGHAYFTARHFTQEAQHARFDRDDRLWHITTDDGRAYVVGDDFYELFVYRDILFISETVVERIFGFRVLRQDGYLVVTSPQNTRLENELLEIAKILFAP